MRIRPSSLPLVVLSGDLSCGIRPFGQNQLWYPASIIQLMYSAANDPQAWQRLEPVPHSSHQDVAPSSICLP